MFTPEELENEGFEYQSLDQDIRVVVERDTQSITELAEPAVIDMSSSDHTAIDIPPLINEEINPFIALNMENSGSDSSDLKEPDVNVDNNQTTIEITEADEAQSVGSSSSDVNKPGQPIGKKTAKNTILEIPAPTPEQIEEMNAFIAEFEIITKTDPQESFLEGARRFIDSERTAANVVNGMRFFEEWVHKYSCKLPGGKGYNLLNDKPMLTYLGTTGALTLVSSLLAKFDLFPEVFNKMKEPILETVTTVFFMQHFKKEILLPGGEYILFFGQALTVANGVMDLVIDLFEDNEIMQQMLQENRHHMKEMLGALEVYAKGAGLGISVYEALKVFFNIMVNAYLVTNLPEIELALQCLIIPAAVIGIGCAASEEMNDFFKYLTRVSTVMGTSWTPLVSFINCVAKGINPEKSNDGIKTIWGLMGAFTGNIVLQLGVMWADAEETVKKKIQEASHDAGHVEHFNKEKFVYDRAAPYIEAFKAKVSRTGFFSQTVSGETNELRRHAVTYGTSDQEEIRNEIIGSKAQNKIIVSEEDNDETNIMGANV